MAKQLPSAKEASEEGRSKQQRSKERSSKPGKKQQTSEEATIEGSNAGEGLSGSNVADGRKQCGRWKEAMASKVWSDGEGTGENRGWGLCD